jgi:diguanylate cyclase (GGDEF)-like protein
VSPTFESLVTATGGVLAGISLAGGLLWRQQRALNRARYDAIHDDTTGLPNRRATLAHLRHALRRRYPVGVVLLDLDRFKTINDTFGHDAGNRLLAAVADRLTALPPPVGLAARLSGDEFVLVVHGGVDQTAAAAHTAWQAIGATPIPLAEAMVEVSASVGYASARIGIGPRQLLRDADEAMYQAKSTGAGVRGHTCSTDDTDTPPVRRYRDRHRHR